MGKLHITLKTGESVGIGLFVIRLEGARGGTVRLTIEIPEATNGALIDKPAELAITHDATNVSQ